MGKIEQILQETDDAVLVSSLFQLMACLLGGGGFFLQYFSLSKSEKHLQNDFNEGSRCICHWMAIFITQEHIMLNCVFLCTIKNLSWHWCLVITLLSLDTFHGIRASKQVLFFLSGLIKLTRPGANFCT